MIYLILLTFSNNTYKYIDVFLSEKRAKDYIKIHQDTDLTKGDEGNMGILSIKEIPIVTE